MSTKTAFFAALSLQALAGVSAHFGCDSYQHGVDLYKRDPSQAFQEAELRRRHPEVNARVLGQDDLVKRATPTTYAATLTQVNVSYSERVATL
jgi:hypothetical protein